MRFVIGLLFCGAWFAQPVLADVVRLQQGGELRGEFVTEGTTTAETAIGVTTLDGILIEVARADVTFSEQRPRVVEEYFTRLRDCDGTIQSHWELAEWCRSMRLYPQREERLQFILALDPDHADARRILGYQNYNGKWMTRDQFMESRGYVLYKAKWITPQERDLREKTEAQREAESAWIPKVRLWVGWLEGTDPARRQTALAQLRLINDPDALSAVARLMREHRLPVVRLEYITILAQMPQGKGTPGLVDRLLYDSVAEVRHAARQQLTTEHYAAAVAPLIEGLRAADNLVVRRAADVLGNLNDPAVVPALIQALVTSHRVQVPVASNSAISFGRTADGRVGSVSPGRTSLPPEIAGMLAAGQLPYGVNVVPFGPSTQRVQLVTVQVEVTNPQVLDALRKLTGQDFGYHERDWQLWWALQQS
ncbi:MAG: HEAT repeat domain-containing protein [Planctomycetaceae bacterium]|nr:HEAT repeat domain-containing protein [Planctomycetaceae bacterium]